MQSELVVNSKFKIQNSKSVTDNSQSSMFNAQRSIELLPALPDNWKNGSVSGIRARGGVSVSMEWKESKVTALTLTSQQPAKITLMVNGQVKVVKLKKGDNKIKC
jgi:alpha-L-fucosidase 2